MEKQSMSIYLRDLERITKGFSDQLKIGSGGYGEVYKGVYKGEEIAVKMLHNDLAFEDKTFENEFANLMRINHPNIVRLIGYCYETQHKHVEYKGELRFSQYTYRILCFEYMQGGSLDKYLKESRDHDWQTRYKITKGICEGLYFLHRGWSTPIFHLDLKPANILLDKSLAPKIADFGLSKLFNGTHTYTAGTCTGSIEYMPPEFLKNRHVSEKYDVYSLGIIIIQIIAGRTGYSEFSEMEDAPRFIELVNRNWSQYIDATTSPCPSSELDQVDTCIKMAIECVDPERKNRPTIAKILHILNETEKRFPVEWRNRAQFLDKSLSTPTIGEPIGGRPLDVVIVYAFDCTTWTGAYGKVDDVFWLVQEKLTHRVDSSLGYTFVMSTPNTYTSEMKLVDSTESKENDYMRSSVWRNTACTKNMASGLPEAHKLMRDHGNLNGIILFFSDGLVSNGDFFHGAEDFISQVPVHTFTVGGGAYNHGLRAIARNSPGGMFSPLPVPDKPSLSVPFSQLMDRILTMKDDCHDSGRGRWPLDVVIVYGFDCTTWTAAYGTMDSVFWLVQEKLTQFVDSCLGYTFVMSTSNTYTSEMKPVDSTDTKEGSYTKSSAWRNTTCTKNMASGLPEAHKLISEHGHLNGIILLFSDGLINQGDFFDGAEDFVSKVPVHTFTLGGDAYNHVLGAIARNSPGGKFHPIPVPDKPSLSVPFSLLLDNILNSTLETSY